MTDDYSCKLTDFGCAKLIHDRQVLHTVNSGTPLWMAPEVKQGTYTFSADIFSIGLVLYELFERKLPAWDDNRKVVILPQSFPSAKLVIPCINSMPEKRPSAQQVVNALDKNIKHIIESLKNSLPKPDQEHLATQGGNGDALENDLVNLYKYFLSRPPEEVDQLIMKYCGDYTSKRTHSNPPVVTQQHAPPPTGF